jgi:regulator of PEP synthase PpsR (kinase-PPPase family)
MSITLKSLRRTAFFISDRTGITAEKLGHSLLKQFENLSFTENTLPYLDTLEKASAAVTQINQSAIIDGARPLVFSTLVNLEIQSILKSANALHLDCFNIFIKPLERELGTHSSLTVGLSHRADDIIDYHQRIESVNYSLAHDDGTLVKDLQRADIILVGVSRSGKTPTCLYLALQYGIRAANYPFIPEDFSSMLLPVQLKNLKEKLFGLTIDPVRLHQIRSERKLDSKYASLENCQYETHEAEALMRQEGIPYLDVTNKSIEELATTLLHHTQLERRTY